MNSKSRKFSFALAGLMVWSCLIPFAALSEPYKVRKGDTLAGIAHRYGTTVQALKVTNHIANVNAIRSGRVLIIPEGATRNYSASATHSIGHTVHKASTVPASHATMVEDLQRGLDNGWVVTRNPEGKIFVHASEEGGVLSGLRYLIQESPDGNTWRVYRPVHTSSGTEYGRMVGVIEKPSNVSVGQCSCE